MIEGLLLAVFISKIDKLLLFILSMNRKQNMKRVLTDKIRFPAINGLVAKTWSVVY